AVLDEYRLTTALHCQEQLDMLAAAKLARPLDAFVKLNVGMNRLGFPQQAYADAWRQADQLRQQGTLGRVGKMSHFARADDDPDTTRLQLNCFNGVTQGLPGPYSVCNSAATL